MDQTLLLSSSAFSKFMLTIVNITVKNPDSNFLQAHVFKTNAELFAIIHGL